MNRCIKHMPKLGFGTWNRDCDEAYLAVRDALGIGYKHIDTAQAHDKESVDRASTNIDIQRE